MTFFEFVPKFLQRIYTAGYGSLLHFILRFHLLF